MKKVVEILKGKKTYILAALAGVYVALVGMEVVPNSAVVWGLLGTGSVAALRAGIDKAGK